MFRMKFKKSRSKNYPLVEKLESKFYEHTIENDTHSIDISVKELFEKWDYFNLMFWKSISWEGSTFGYDNYDLHSRTDKTRLFYSLQLAHTRWINLSEQFLKLIAPVYFDGELIDPLRVDVFNEEEVDRLLDLIISEKNLIDYKEEFGDLKFEAPLRNCDFEGRRLAREKKKLSEK